MKAEITKNGTLQDEGASLERVVSLRLVKNKRNYEQEVLASNGGFIKDCDIETRWGESYFGYNADGATIVTLKGYSILPKEIYRERMSYLSWGFWRRLKFLLTAS